jgi:putative ABC transport system permease protein
LRNCLLALQVSFTMILLVGGGLFGRSVMRAWSIDPGFPSEGLLTAAFSAPSLGSESFARFRRAQQVLTERLRTTPGVRSATLGSQPLFNSLHPKAQIDTEKASVTADRLNIDPDFFKTMGIPLLSGRPFTNLDTETAPKVAIVNQTLAGRLWPGANPLGRTVQVQKSAMQVVGLVRESKYGSVWEDTPPTLYVALSQADVPGSYLILRTGGVSGNIVAAISREWSGIFPNSPLYNFKTDNDLLNLTLAPQRMAAWVFGAFGLIAIVLASVGIYSSVSYAVARRTREIGIRLAIGAEPSTIMRRIVFQSLQVAAGGLIAGTFAGLLLTRFISSRVKGVSVYDTATFVSVAALMGGLALFAAAIPARRAAKLDPQVALRS